MFGGTRMKCFSLIPEQKRRRRFPRCMSPGAYTLVSLYLLTMKNTGVRARCAHVTYILLFTSFNLTFVLSFDSTAHAG